MGMKMNLSHVEVEELTKHISDAYDARQNKETAVEIRKREIAEEVRDAIRKSAGGGFPFVQPTNPLDIVTIEKAITCPSDSTEYIDIYKKVQEFNDDLYTLISILKVHPSQLRTFPQLEKRWSELAKALNTQDAGSGLEWIPTGYSSQMIEFIELAAIVSTKFNTITMPTPSYIYPTSLTPPVAYIGGESTTDSPAMFTTSTPGTSNITFTAKKIVVNVPVSDEMVEDSIIAMLPFIRKSLPKALARAIDIAIINGDISTTHMDTGYTVATKDVRRLWNGLRKIVADATTALSTKKDFTTWTTALGLALMTDLQDEMGVYGIMEADLMWLVNTSQYRKMVSLDEVRTVDKFGARATINNGVINGIDGIEIIKTEDLKENVNASGVYDGTTTTMSQMLLVNKKAFWNGVRREMTLDFEKQPLTGNQYMVASTRRAFRAIYDTGSEPVVGWGYNITK